MTDAGRELYELTRADALSDVKKLVDSLSSVDRTVALHYKSIEKEDSALHVACSAAAVKELLDLGFRTTIRDGEGRSPLHYAAKHGCLEVASALLMEGASVFTADRKGNTALHYSCFSGDSAVDITKALLRSKADMWSTNNNGKTAVDIAFDAASLKTQSLLCQYMERQGTDRAVIDAYRCASSFLASVRALNVEATKKTISILGRSVNLALHETMLNGTPSSRAILKELLHGSPEISANVNALHSRSGLSPLHAACIEGHLPLVRHMVGVCGADTTSLSASRKATPLHLACKHNRVTIASYLIDRGADVNALDVDKRPPLHYACERLAYECVDLLLRKGANASVVDSSGLSLLHVLVAASCHQSRDRGRQLRKNDEEKYLEQMDEEQSKGNVKETENIFQQDDEQQEQNQQAELLCSLIAKGAVVSAQEEYRGTPLHIACRWNHDPITRALLQHGADVDAVDRDGRTPLHLAIWKASTVRVLLDSNLYPNPFVPNNEEETPKQSASGEVLELLLQYETRVADSFWRACAQNDISVVRRIAQWPDKSRSVIVRYLPEKSPLGLCDIPAGELISPIHVAAYHGHEHLIGTLVDLGASPDSRTQPSELTALMISTKRCLRTVITKLLSRGADINLQDNSGYTVLHHCVLSGAEELIELLLSAGCDPELNDVKGETALDLSMRKGKDDAVAGLLKYGAAVCSDHIITAIKSGDESAVRELLWHDTYVDHEDREGNVPLHFAARRGHVGIVRALLDVHADVNAENDKGETPLHLAARFGHCDVMTELIARGADTSAQTNSQWDTPLHYAISHGRVESVRLLMQHCLRYKYLDSSNKQGRSGIHMASSNGDCVMIQFLLDGGASLLEARTKADATPLHEAALQNHPRALALLATRAPSLVDVHNKTGRTPLHYAAAKGFDECVTALLENGADPAARSGHHFTPLHCAAEQGHARCVHLMLQSSRNPLLGLQLNRDLEMPLDLARSNGHTAVVEVIQKALQEADKGEEEEEEERRQTEETQDRDVENREIVRRRDIRNIQNALGKLEKEED